LEQWRATAHDVAKALGEPEVCELLVPLFEVTGESWGGDPGKVCEPGAAEKEREALLTFVDEASDDLSERWAED
jgi:hypothetical protein